MKKIILENSWKEKLLEEFNKDYMRSLSEFLRSEKSKNKIIFPPGNKIFNAFNLTKFEDVKVVILGQDPYHGLGQANGLSFSVNKKIFIPPSLKNIFLELKNDLNVPISQHGDLTSWAQQKILLLNSVLTVEQGKPNSHKELGWDKLTDRIISRLSQRGNMIFVLWGKIAQSKLQLINKKTNKVLSAPHPSPLSAYRGFFGCRHFSKINKILIESGSSKINWKLD